MVDLIIRAKKLNEARPILHHQFFVTFVVLVRGLPRTQTTAAAVAFNLTTGQIKPARLFAQVVGLVTSHRFIAFTVSIGVGHSTGTIAVAVAVAVAVAAAVYLGRVGVAFAVASRSVVVGPLWAVGGECPSRVAQLDERVAKNGCAVPLCMYMCMCVCMCVYVVCVCVYVSV